MKKIWSLRKGPDPHKHLMLWEAAPMHNYPPRLGSADSRDETTVLDAQDKSGATQNPSIQNFGSSSSLQEATGSDYSVSVSSTATASSPSVALVDASFDDSLLSAGWLNIVFKAGHATDSDSNLRLCFAELRGSRLFIYKAPANINIKNFHLDTNGSNQRSKPVAAPQLNLPASLLSHTPLISSPAMTAHTQNGISETSVPPSPLPSAGDKNPLAASSVSVLDQQISYSSCVVPHPQLAYDMGTHRFLSLLVRTDESGSASDLSFPPLRVESLVHFYLFATDPLDDNVAGIMMHVLPLLPSFLGVMTWIHKMVVATFAGYMSGPCDKDLLTQRIGKLLLHVEANYGSYLFRQDISRLVTATIELLATRLNGLARENALKAHLLIDTCKSRIHSRQQSFFQLMATHSFTQTTAEDPSCIFQSASFMESVDLYALATAICDIDLAFACSWNSNIDKSLLLDSTLSPSTSLPADRSFFRRNPLIFKNDVQVHYLSRLFVHHLFSDFSQDLCLESIRSLTFRAKARILERWIDLGCLLDKMGNMSSWLGIATIILSQPILRLTGIWSSVSSRYIALLRNDWLPVLYELDRRYLSNGPIKAKMPAPSSSVPNLPNPNRPTTSGEISFDANDSFHIMAPRGIGKIYSKNRVVPYFGDLLIHNSKDGCSLLAGLDKIWKKINYSFGTWGKYLKNLIDFPRVISYNDLVVRDFATHRKILSNENSSPLLCMSSEVSDKDIEAFRNNSTNASDSLASEFIEPLLALIAKDADSLNLEKIMQLSLELDPIIPEAYSKDQITSQTTVSGTMLLETSTLANNTMINAPLLTRYAFQQLFSKVVFDPYQASTVTGSAEPAEDTYTCTTSGVTFSQNAFAGDSHGDHTDVESELEVASPALLMGSDAFGMWTPSDSFSPMGAFDQDLIKNQSQIQDQRLGLSVLPQFSTVDRLIDMLLIEIAYFSENLYLDMSEYREIFIMTYPSFVTTHGLLEILTNRFISSGNAVISVMKRSHLKLNNPNYASLTTDCPNWNLDPDADMASLGAVDYSLLLQIQTNILKVLISLLSNGYSLFASDLANTQLMIKLMKLFSNEIIQWFNSHKIDPSLLHLFERLVDHYRRLKKLFIKKAYRPMELTRRDSFIQYAFRFANTVAEVPHNRNLPGHKNTTKIEKFLNKFDKMAQELFASTRAEDWSKAFMLLESITGKDAYVEFDFRQNSRHKKRMRIRMFADFLQDLTWQDSTTCVWERLPAVLRKALKLHRKLRVYLQLQLTDMRIGDDERLDRMKTVLLMAKICQLKMSNYSIASFETTGSIPSFFETALTSVIYSPESRVYAAEWYKAANTLNPDGLAADLDDLSTLLPQNLRKTDLAFDGSLTPCFSWILENVCQLAKDQSFRADSVNFTKHLLRYKLIRNLRADLNAVKLHTSDVKDFEFLFSLSDYLCPTFSQLSNGLSALAPSVRLFEAVLNTQKKISAENEIVNQALTAERVTPAEDPVPEEIVPDKAPEMAQRTLITKKASLASLKRQLLAYRVTPSSRFKISGIFGKTKPSTGFAAAGPQDKTVSAQDLPPFEEAAIAPSTKPHMVIPLRSRKTFPVYILPLGFRVESDNAEDQFFFQAPSEQELGQWLKVLDYALRHWFRSSALNKKYISAHTTFGLPLEYVCSRDRAMVPCMLLDIFQEIEQHCIDDVGIYRISTSVSEVANAKQTIDKLGTLNFEERGYDAHVLASMVKLFFRELPSALVLDETIDSLVKIRQQLSGALDESIMFEQYRCALRTLKPTHYHTLCALIEHLHKVSSRSSHNKMTPSNLATVVGPALTEALSMDALVTNFGSMNTIVESLITNYDQILGGWLTDRYFEPIKI